MTVLEILIFFFLNKTSVAVIAKKSVQCNVIANQFGQEYFGAASIKKP